MARQPGSKGLVSIDGTAVAQVAAAEWTERATWEDTTPTGQNGRRVEPLIFESSGQIDVWADTADTGAALLVVGATVEITLEPEGSGSGLALITISGALITESPEGFDPSSYNRARVSWEAGEVVRSTQP